MTFKTNLKWRTNTSNDTANTIVMLIYSITFVFCKVNVVIGVVPILSRTVKFGFCSLTKWDFEELSDREGETG